MTSAPAPPPPPPPPEPPSGPLSTLALVAVVLSLSGLLVVVTAPVGAILGHVALGRLRRTGERGRELAITAIIAGWVLTLFGILAIVAIVLVSAALSASLSPGR